MTVSVQAVLRSTLGNAGSARPAPQLTIIFSMVEGEAPSAMALQSRAPADLPCRSNGEFMPLEEQSLGSLSSHGVLGDS